MKLNYAAYIKAQIMRVRAERDGEMQLITPDGQTYTLSHGKQPVRDSEDILREIDGLRGLNVEERETFAQIRRASAARSQTCNIA